VKPSDLVTTLDPPQESIIKREDRTLVWRERRPDGTPTVVKLYRARRTPYAIRSRVLRFRAEREYRRLCHLERWGVPCTEPLAWGEGHSTEHAHHEVLVMREVPNAVELGDWIGEAGADAFDRDLTPLLRIVRRMHESGFCHQTLYARNVLVDREAAHGKEFFLADVPRSWTFPRSIAGTAMAWWDVLDLVVELEDAGFAGEDRWLEAYGMNAAGRQWWARKRAEGSDPRKKRTRLGRDGAARMRWGIAWGKPWNWGTRTPNTDPSKSRES